jgi:DNA-binding CsgD family transcriptional regulator
VHELVHTARTEDGALDARRIGRLAPDGISRAVLARLRRLGAGPCRLAFATAVLGATAELRHAAALAELDRADAGDAADALAAVAILGKNRPLEFVHPVVRTAVYAEIPAARRAATHRRAAKLMHDDGAPAAAVAAHLLAAEPSGDAWVVQRLREAAATALNAGAAEAACGYLERAVSEPPPPDERALVLQELGSAEFHAARPQAARTLRLAYDAAGDDVSRARGIGQLALALAATGRADEGIELLARMAARIGADDQEAALGLDAHLAGLMQMDLTSARRIPRQLAKYDGLREARTPGERLVLAMMAIQAGLSAAATADETARLALSALGEGRLLREQEPDAQPFYMAVTAMMWAGRFEHAADAFGAAIDDARVRGSAFGFGIASAGRCVARFRLGSLAAAEADGRAALDALIGVGAGLLPMVVAYVLPTLVERSPPAECEALLAATRTDAELPPHTICNRLLHARGHLRLAGGHPQRALDDFEELQRRDELLGMVNPAAWPTRSSTALAHLRLGRRADAQRLAADELEIARRWGEPGAVACSLRAAALADDGGRRVELLRESVAFAERSEARYGHACSLTELGAALRCAGHPRDARVPLREGLDLAHRCGAPALEARAREELMIAGGRPRRPTLHGVDALTASELRIARAAASGLPNRDIAQALFVTVRTVEGHLTHAYRKLGIGSRDQLGQALAADVSR